MAVGDYVPLLGSVAFLLFVGLVFPFVLSFFVDVNDIDISSSSTQSLITLVSDGITVDLPLIDPFTFNPFSLIGSSAQNSLIESLYYLGLLPSFLVTFIIILCMLSLIYAIIKLVPIIY